MWPLPKTFFPHHAANRMRAEGDLSRARTAFLGGRTANLDLLLKNRFAWMSSYLRPDQRIVEIGSGAGFAPTYLPNIGILLSEISPHPWIDICLDATNLPFAPASLDAVLCVNALHHFPYPLRFLRDVAVALRPGGHLLVFEPNPSLIMLGILRIMRHEGWSFERDVFDTTMPVSDQRDPWSGNNAVSALLFRNKTDFHTHCPEFEIVEDRLCECLIFLLSGGVTAKTRTMPLPPRALAWLDALDGILCGAAPGVFAMGRIIALRRRP